MPHAVVARPRNHTGNDGVVSCVAVKSAFDTTAFEDNDEFDEGRTGKELLGMRAEAYNPGPTAWDAMF